MKRGRRRIDSCRAARARGEHGFRTQRVVGGGAAEEHNGALGGARVIELRPRDEICDAERIRDLGLSSKRLGGGSRLLLRSPARASGAAHRAARSGPRARRAPALMTPSSTDNATRCHAQSKSATGACVRRLARPFDQPGRRRRLTERSWSGQLDRKRRENPPLTSSTAGCDRSASADSGARCGKSDRRGWLPERAHALAVDQLPAHRLVERRVSAGRDRAAREAKRRVRKPARRLPMVPSSRTRKVGARRANWLRATSRSNSEAGRLAAGWRSHAI